MTFSAGDLLKPEVVRGLARLDLQARSIARSYLQGLHRSPYHGFSTEFSEHRKYEPGDPVTNIDWRVYARTDRYYVRRFEAETSMPTVLFLDRSASMGYAFKDGAVTKHEYACYLCAALSYLMLRQKDPVGLVVFSDGIDDYVPPRCRPGQLGALLSRMVRHGPSGASNPGRVMRRASRVLRRAGLAVMVSDLHTELDPLRDGVAALRFRRNEVVLFRVLDEAETRFPFRARVRLRDLETGETIDVDPEHAREPYLARLAAHTAALTSLCAGLGTDFAALDTSVPFDRALTAYLRARSQRC